MNKNYKLSKFFTENKVSTSGEVFSLPSNAPGALPGGFYKTADYCKAKHIRAGGVQSGNRTICSMLRTVNFLTKYMYEDRITKITAVINNSVLQLRKYKLDFDSGWWNNSSDSPDITTSFTRSKFSGEKAELAKNLIKLEHDIFQNFMYLYDECEDENVKPFLLECVYYTHRINEKLVGYEGD